MLSGEQDHSRPSIISVLSLHRTLRPIGWTLTIHTLSFILQEKEAVFVLDHRRISEIDMASGRTKRRTPKLQPLLPRVLAMAASHNGAERLWA